MYIIIDSNYICHVAKHSMGNLSFEEKRVGVIFGFLRQILSFAKRFNTNQLIFAWDSKESKRREFYADYKANRIEGKTEEDKELDAIIYSQFDTIRNKVIPRIGFVNNFIVRGYEADDIIAQITKNYSSEEFVIITSDSDLLQLLNYGMVTIFNPKTKTEYTERTMAQAYGISPKEWAMVKAIAGCVSDNVPGVKGVGEKTAIKYLNGELKESSAAYAKIRDFPDLHRNKVLVTLPYKGCPSVKVRKQPNTSYRGMYEVCEQYGFQSLLNKEAIQQWLKSLRAE